MFYPKCPKCGGGAKSAETTHFEQVNGVAGQALRRAAHRHPYLQALHFTATAARAVYKRVPGGGEKECTACGHRFR